MAEEKNDWWTSPTEGPDGKTIIVTGRRDVAAFRNKGKYTIRVTVAWPYTPADAAGFPDDETARLMEQVTDAFHEGLKGKTTAILTGIYTGDGSREWVFYTFSTDTFGKFLNRVLAPLPLLPLEISAENDPEWEEYDEMKAESEVDL